MLRSSPTADRRRWDQLVTRAHRCIVVEILADGGPPALGVLQLANYRPTRHVEILADGGPPALAARHITVGGHMHVEILADGGPPALGG